MAAPETTNNVTVRRLSSLMSQLWTKIKNALQGKQDDLGISSSGDSGKFLNQKGTWAVPSGTEQVNADWDATSGKAEILHKPQNLVQDDSYVHTDNNYTTNEKNKLAGIASGAEVNVQSDWNQSTTTADDYIKNKPTVSRYFNKYSSNTSVYGWKIGSTVTDNANNKTSVITGSFTLALGINTENAPQESTAVKTKATMVGFFSCYARYENGANVVKARIYTPVSSISDSTFNLKYIDEGNGKFTWVLGFGTGTTPASKNYVYCSVNVMSEFNADFGNFGDAITSAPTYGDYFSGFKSPAIGQNTSGVGDATKPAYVDSNGFMKTCSGTVSRSICYTTAPQGLASSVLESYDTIILPSGANPSVNVSDFVIDKPYKFYVNGSYSGSHPFKMSFAKGTLSSYTVYTGGSSSTKTGTYSFSQEIKSQPVLVVHSVSGTTHNLFIVGY